MTTQFQKRHGAKTCPYCKTKTSLWAEDQDVCDVCYDAGGAMNSFYDGCFREADGPVIDDEEKAKEIWKRYARQTWPSLSDDRLNACWS